MGKGKNKKDSEKKESKKKSKEKKSKKKSKSKKEGKKKSKSKKSKKASTKKKISRKKIGLLVIGLVVGGIIGYLLPGAGSLGGISTSGCGQSLGEEAQSYVVDNFLAQQGLNAEVGKVTKKGKLCKVTLSITRNGSKLQDSQVYMTPSGDYLILGQVIPTSPNESESRGDATDTQETQSGQDQQQAQFDAPDKENPTVELFLMSFCPYGNKAEQTLKPVFKELKDEVNWEPHYIVNEKNGKITSLHGETEVAQDKRELCVLEDHGVEKWFDFVTYVNENCGSSGSCWKDAAESIGIDSTEIQTCADERGKGLLKEEASYAKEKGATGSPTMLINDKKTKAVYQYGNPNTYLEAVCTGFSEAPDACSTDLGTGSSTSSGGQC